MKLIKTDKIDIYYVTEDKDIQEVILFCKSKKELSLDTETMVDLSKLNPSALDPHSSKISLVQVNSRDNEIPYILDFLSLSVFSKNLFNTEVLLNNNILKVLHYSSFDLKQFYKEFGVWPKNTLCTQTLMKSLAICTGMKASLFRGHSLKDLARDYFDIILNKEEATSSWGTRPLTESQLGYAGLDVGAPKNLTINSILLEGYYLFKDQLDLLNQQLSYKSDQMGTILCAKMEYEGMFVDKNILNKITAYAELQTNTYRKILVENLNFTVYTDTIINADGEWEVIQVIPDKIKILLNNNKGLVTYINKHLSKEKNSISLTSLQADEIKLYLDMLESEVLLEKSGNIFDEDFLLYKYENIKLIKSLLKYKKYSKLFSECTKYLNAINPNTNRIHAGFSSVGASTGRMSSSGSVNLQQISSTSVHIVLDKEQF